jgi:hypothetical protein
MRGIDIHAVTSYNSSAYLKHSSNRLKLRAVIYTNELNRKELRGP